MDGSALIVLLLLCFMAVGPMASCVVIRCLSAVERRVSGDPNADQYSMPVGSGFFGRRGRDDR